jgi:DNA polymerase III subunit delta'
MAPGTAGGEIDKWFPGQPAAARALRAAAARPVHAYLLVGPPGTGKLAAAKAFAATLVCPQGGEDGCETCRRAMDGAHPDVTVLEREGAALTIDQAREVGRLAARSPLQAVRSVVIVPDLHLARDAAPALLKALEEPSAPVVIVGLAEFVPPELVTIASRCVRVDFRPLSEDELVAVLVAEGASPQRAEVGARLAGGRLDRARLLAADPAAEQRWLAWAGVPQRLDGSGATIAQIAEELVELLKQSAEPLVARQEAELAALARSNEAAAPNVPARIAQGVTRQGARELEERHKREQRRQRTDELRGGLAALAGAYRDMVALGQQSPLKAVGAVALIDQLSADLAFNPGELLALQALFVKLDRLAAS